MPLKLIPLVLTVGVFLLRPRITTWGATPEEVAEDLPGDDLVPGAVGRSTMATTILAPPSAVWPWLVQMGTDRGGFYSWDRLDNQGRPSAERIHPEWQGLKAGDRIVSVPSGGAWFDVAACEPERDLVLRASLDLSGHPFDPTGRPPHWFTDSRWSFHLRPAPGDATRLIVRAEGKGRPRPLLALGRWLFWEPAHWVMQTRQFSNLNRRASALAPWS
jgi:hypothetical protein